MSTSAPPAFSSLPLMVTVEHLPVELLMKILHFATHFEDSNRMGNLGINWHSRTTLFFQRDLALRKVLIATKASIVLVCRLWNTLAASWLHEHVTIDSATKLDALAEAFDLENSNITRFALLVKWLDVELEELEETSQPGVYGSLALVLVNLPNLVTLTMMMPLCNLMHHLLPAIHASVQHLFWSSPTPHGSAPPLSQVSAADLFKFLECHPRLETISFPFPFNPVDVSSTIRTGYKKRHHTIREWVTQNSYDFINLLMLVNSGVCPEAACHTMTWQPHTTGILMPLLLGGFASYIPGASTPSSSRITNFSLVVGLPNQRWPPELLADNLHIIRDICPNLREFNLTFTSETGDVYDSPMQPDIVGLHPVPQITTVSIQRIVKNSDLSNPVGTLHHAIRVPWRTVFPSLQAIRIHENVDLGEVMEHPTMAFVREGGWTIRIEDRFGESPA